LKTAIYIEDGVLQVVITPESEFEKRALSTLENKPLEAQIFSGAFYDCRGGWVRQTAYHANYSSGDTSLIVRIAEPKPAEPGPDFNPAKVIAEMKAMTGQSAPAPDVE
jgi:hypothetical protein